MKTNKFTLIADNSNTSTNKTTMDEKYSDLTIICHGRHFKVHKIIICPQSHVLSKLCDIDMREKRTGIVKHEEFDDDTVERMIDYVYNKKYGVTRRPKDLPSKDDEGLITDTETLATADVPAAEGVALEQDDGATPRIEGIPAAESVALPQDDGAAPAIDGEQVELSPAEKGIIYARVYGLADCYDISELRHHARSNFMEVADEEPGDKDLKGFADVAREICKITTRFDDAYKDPLRADFLSLVARYASKLTHDTDFVAGLYEPELQDSAGDIFVALGHRMSDLETQVTEMTASFEAEKEVLQKSVSAAQADAENQIANAKHGQRVAEQLLSTSKESWSA